MNDIFKAKDLNLSAFLYAKGQSLERVERENGVCWFVFNNQEKSKLLAGEFWSGHANCNITDYTNAIRLLKDRIFSEKT